MAVDLYVSRELDPGRKFVGPDGCIGCPEAAILAGVTRQRVCQAICAGKLKATQCPRGPRPSPRGRGVWRIRLEDLMEWRQVVQSRD